LYLDIKIKTDDAENYTCKSLLKSKIEQSISGKFDINRYRN